MAPRLPNLYSHFLGYKSATANLKPGISTTATLVIPVILQLIVLVTICWWTTWHCEWFHEMREERRSMTQSCMIRPKARVSPGKPFDVIQFHIDGGRIHSIILMAKINDYGCWMPHNLGGFAFAHHSYDRTGCKLDMLLRGPLVHKGNISCLMWGEYCLYWHDRTW